MVDVPKSLYVILLVAVALLGTIQGVTISSSGMHVGGVGQTNKYIECRYDTYYTPLALSWHNGTETIARWILANPYPYIAPKYEGHFYMDHRNYGSYGYTNLIIHQVNESMTGLACAIEDSQPDTAVAYMQFCTATHGSLTLRLYYTDIYGSNHTIQPYQLLQLDPSSVRSVSASCSASNFKPEPYLRIELYFGCYYLYPDSIHEETPNRKDVCALAPPSSMEYTFNFDRAVPIFGTMNSRTDCIADSVDSYNIGRISTNFYFRPLPFNNCTQCS